MTFSKPMTLHFGGRTIRLFRVEPSTHARDLIVMYFVEDRTLFAVDIMSVKSVGFFDFSNENFPAMVAAIRNLGSADRLRIIWWIRTHLWAPRLMATHIWRISRISSLACGGS